MPNQLFRLSQSKPSRFTSVMRWARVFWASPTSFIGLLLALLFLLAGAQWRRVDGVLEVALKPRTSLVRSRSRPRSPWRLPFTAITFGHVVLGISPHELDRLRAHPCAPVRTLGSAVPARLPAGGCVAMGNGKTSLSGQPVRGGSSADGRVLMGCVRPAAVLR